MPRTLFGRTAALLLAAFVLLQGLALGVVWQTVVTPLAERTADNLAARMLLAAQTWVELPPETRPDYELELSLHHSLELGAVATPLPRALPGAFFDRLVARALSRRSGSTLTLKAGPDPAWAWAELQVAGQLIRVGFLRDSYALTAPWAAIGVLLGGALATLALALLLVGQTSLRLRSLAQSAQTVGQGRRPERLPETGAEEIRRLTAAFNRMAGEVQSLLENRTTLLAGISHDLKTPLTRMRLALAMLEGASPVLLARLEGDLAEMERLIGDMLTFARSLNVEAMREIDLAALLADLSVKTSRQADVRCPPLAPCPWPVAEGALRRIVANLLENALRYGDGQPVEMRLACGEAAARIGVLDRGPGIPAAERDAVFRPFYRIEASRSRDSGGSGLGLAIARQLADAHGWRIELGDRPGGGLAAEVVLPRRPMQPPHTTD